MKHFCKKGLNKSPCGNLTQCWYCYLYAYSPSHNSLWGGSGVTATPRGRLLSLGEFREYVTGKPIDSSQAALVLTIPQEKSRELCKHLGNPTGVEVQCSGCRNNARIKLFVCEVHGQCTLAKDVGAVVCKTCSDWEPKESGEMGESHRPMLWSYGVTTTPKRRDKLLPQTLASLARSGFDKPRLFVDGESNANSWEGEFKLEVTTHWPYIWTHGNWLLSMMELFIREPNCHRYAIFQDDFVCSLNLRSYLEACPYPDRGYLNLYTFPSNQSLATKEGWYLSNQRGKGAVALVFDRDAMLTLFQSKHMVERPMDGTGRGWRSVDGGIVTAMTQAGYKEWVHNPSLTQHTGLDSSMHRPDIGWTQAKHLQAISFRGEEFDLLKLLPPVGVGSSAVVGAAALGQGKT